MILGDGPLDPAGPPRGATLLGWYVVLVVLGMLAALVGGFLIPLRLGRVPVPVSVLVAVLGNIVLAVVGARATGGRPGAVAPWLGWLAVAITLSSGGRGGDIVVTGDLVGYGYLLGGAIAGGMAAVLARPRPRDDPAGRAAADS
ncbi:MAG: hypothetical protein NVSMB13_09100 [Mycobacteriales bacterium]